MSNLSGSGKNPLGEPKQFSASRKYMNEKAEDIKFKLNDSYEGYNWNDHGVTNDFLGKVENYAHNLNNLSTGPLGKCVNAKSIGAFISEPKSVEYVTPKAYVVRPMDVLKAPNSENQN